MIETLEEIADQVLKTTGFFHNGYAPEKPPLMQNGVCRTNCIDCLDRTNAAQFVIGKRALGHQLHALGVINTTSIEYDTDAVNLFTHMFRDHGDTIAVQYAGSHLVNTMETYRGINQWTNHSRDMLESVRRYYNNSFVDAQRQEAINLFLGNYVFVRGHPMLWDLTTDYYLHHRNPREGKRRRSYIKWWTPIHLEKSTLPQESHAIGTSAEKLISFFDDFWLEYYVPGAFEPLELVFSNNLNSASKYIPFKITQYGKYDLSPFKVRVTYADSLRADPAKRKRQIRKSVKIALQLDDVTGSGNTGQIVEEENEEEEGEVDEKAHNKQQTPLIAFPWSTDTTQQQQEEQQQQGGTGRSNPQFGDSGGTPPNSLNSFPKPFYPSLGSPSKSSFSFSSATATAAPGLKHHPLPPLEDIISELLSPSVSASDEDEYSRYMSHPHNLPLVTSTTPEPPTIPSSCFGNTSASRSTCSATTSMSICTSTSSVNKKPTPVMATTPQHYSNFYNYVNMPNLGVDALIVKDEDKSLYDRFVRVREDKNVLGEEIEGEGGLGLGGGGGPGGMWKKRYKAYQTWLTTGRLKNMAGGGGVGAGRAEVVTGGNAAGAGNWFAPEGNIVGGLSQAMKTKM